MNYQRLFLRKIPSFPFFTKRSLAEFIASIHTSSQDKVSNQKDMSQQGLGSGGHYKKPKKPKVAIIGCSYAGMSATLTLAALKDGLAIPFASYGGYSHLRDAPSMQDFNITMIDERDGFCTYYPYLQVVSLGLTNLL